MGSNDLEVVDAFFAVLVLAAAAAFIVAMAGLFLVGAACIVIAVLPDPVPD